MYATHGAGLDVTLCLADKEKGKKEGRLECEMCGGKNPKLVIHIISRVPWQVHLEEPGFHITAKPKKVAPEERTRYDIWLSRERFRALTNPVENPTSIGGYFVSRCLFDRVDIKYFAV